MAEPLSTDEVAHVARLARLDLSQTEVETYTEQLAAVLGHFADVEGLDTGDVEVMTHPVPLKNVLRKDEVRPSLDRQEVLAMAPDTESGMFRVPRILSEEP